ncbi:FAD-dependent monooxygenase [Streptomyces sp. NPDC048172]|uniref:FAD-dependent monooxygenase n=1 Tax=Streptomyces sp. NPDC048172 TaxID=3365505 RepID=UPI0037199579
MTRTALVIGAGIGGLATAVALRHEGWDVEVRERAPAPPSTGTSLGLWPGGLRALDALGLGATARGLSREAARGRFVRADGTLIGNVDMEELRRRAGDAVRVISRPALLGALTDALGDGTGGGTCDGTAAGTGDRTGDRTCGGIVRYGQQVTDVRALAADHDVVVAADGLRSRARAALFGPAHRPRYSGVSAWHGTVALDVPDMTETWGDGARFGVTPRKGGTAHWFACARAPERATYPEGELAAVRARFGTWHAGVRQVLDRLAAAGPEGVEVHRNDLYDLAAPLPRYVSGRVALVGDAAHAMTPDLGRGACEALADGVALARELAARDRVEAALSAYDAARRRPTQRLARAARVMNRAVHTRRRVAPVRDAAMRLYLTLGRPPA